MKVSVIIPCYNFGEYIEQSILSAVNQITNFEYEILVRDDFSTDYSQINIERTWYFDIFPKIERIPVDRSKNTTRKRGGAKKWRGN